MAVYSIKDLEQLTGVKAHTIRIWEKRYNIVTPNRTKTNIRYYQDDDLKMLLNVALLNKNGIKISKIAGMTKEVMSEHIAELTETQVEDQSYVDALTLSLIELDSFKFQSILNSNIKHLGFERTMTEVIYPFLEKLSLLWISGSINQIHEKFLNYQVRQKITGAIDQLPLRRNSHRPRFLLFQPHFAHQELSLLFSQFILQSRGFRVVNLGIDLDIEDVFEAIRICNPDYLFLLNVDDEGNSLAGFVQRIVARTDKKCVVSGSAMTLNGLSQNDQIIALRDMEETLEFLEKL